MGSRMMFAICCLASLFFEMVHGDSTLALLMPMTESSVDLTGSSSTFVVNGNLGVYTDSLGVSKPGYSFSPTPGYIVVSQSAALDVGRDTFSIAMWVKFDRLDLKQQIFSHRNRAVDSGCSGTKGYELSLTSSGQLYFSINNANCATISTSYFNVYTPAIFSTNTWYFVGVAFSRTSQSSIYVNGAKIISFSSSTTSDFSNGQAVYLGNGNDGTQQLYGVIGSTVFYSRFLALSEMVALYNEITLVPTSAPSVAPTRQPSSVAPTRLPSPSPTMTPSREPSMTPTAMPSTSSPSRLPSTVTPSREPSMVPTVVPSVAPTLSPSATPSFAPSGPTVQPTTAVPPTTSTSGQSIVIAVVAICCFFAGALCCGLCLCFCPPSCWKTPDKKIYHDTPPLALSNFNEHQPPPMAVGVEYALEVKP